MSADLKNYGYGVSWKDFYTDSYEGYRSRMSDYHMHSYYEISLIFSGNVKVLFPDKMQSGGGCRLVLIRPMTPHLILCEPDLLYSRVNMLFSNDFFSEIAPEWKQLLAAFGKCGFVDTSNMIRCFKKRFNMTPKQYVKAYHK